MSSFDHLVDEETAAVEVDQNGCIAVEEHERHNERMLKEQHHDSERTEVEFPDAFYDPITGNLMHDPVVNPAGDSYEKTTIEDASSGIIYYPNRALKSIIDRQVMLASGSSRASIRRRAESIRHAFGRLVENSAFRFEHKPLPQAYYCPITQDLMVDPVIDPDGHSFERDAIQHWIQANHSSPITRQALEMSALRENNALYDVIQEEKNRTDDSIHPSIRRWKESGATSRRSNVGNQEQQGYSIPPTRHQEPLSDLQVANDTLPIPTNVQPWGTLPTTQAEIRARRRRRVPARRPHGAFSRWWDSLSDNVAAAIFVGCFVAAILAVMAVLTVVLYFVSLGISYAICGDDVKCHNALADD